MVLIPRKTLPIILFSFLILCSCSQKVTETLKPDGYKKESAITIESGNLKAVFVDNTEVQPHHKAGYNGIAQLSHAEEDAAIFVPDYAGFNLEHIFGGDSLHQLFEPRRHPMILYRKRKNEVFLYQEATPLSRVESLTEFRIVGPHYIDITFHCILHDVRFFRHSYAGLFWASYIHKPGDKRIFFKGVSESDPMIHWIPAYSEEHGVNSTHRSITDKNDFFFAENFNARLANHYSKFRFTDPLYFGRFGKMVLAYFFDTEEIIRFSQSPTGGGESNPAWDFQYIIPSPETGKKYSFKVRVVYKPFISEEDISKEYKKWNRSK